MKKLFFILTISSFFYFFSTTSQAADCSEYQSVPQIIFGSSYGKLRYDTSLDNQGITQIAKNYNTIEKGLFASGLATVNVKLKIDLETYTEIRSDYDICVIPDKLHVFIGFVDPVIYISNELPRDSCEYNVVLRHEQTHQQINKSSLDYFIPLFQDAIEKIAGTVPPRHIGSLSEADAATELLIKSYNRKIAPLVNVFKKELLLEQAKLDNSANYEHEKQICQ